MAHNITLSALTANAIADVVAARCDGGTIEIRDGAQPATADTALGAQVLLATCTFGAPAFAAAAAGVATAHAITQDAAADATGTAAWFRAKTSTGLTVLDGTVGVGASFDCNVVSTAVTLGDPFPIASMTITEALT
jgi:hypothetical protein